METFIIISVFLIWQFRYWILAVFIAGVVCTAADEYMQAVEEHKAKRAFIDKKPRTCGCPDFMRFWEPDRHVENCSVAIRRRVQ